MEDNYDYLKPAKLVTNFYFIAANVACFHENKTRNKH